ncbi:MAG: purine phosphoribosyltransferase family protein [Methanomicrobiales archaeon]|jgi:adenine phosphoribosyltransferase|nr:purine phosphoribosyltransferase family protein [Methanomicrobiales archaeon]
MTDILYDSLIRSPIVKKGEYNYFVHPLTDGIPFIHPALLKAAADGLVRVMDLKRQAKEVDYILGCEAMGIPIGTAVSYATDIPLIIVRKRSYGLFGETLVSQTTGYSKGGLYLNCVKKGDRVVIVDDVISTGGTTRALLDALEKIGAKVVDIGFVFSKGPVDIGCPYKILYEVSVTDSVQVVRSF